MDETTLSWNIAELMGGTIRVDSRVGQGSSFIINLWFEELAQGSPNKGVKLVDLNGKHMVVVDDHHFNLRIIADQLGSYGVDIMTLNSGDNLVELLLTEQDVGNKSDVIIVDKRMPGKTGFEVAQEVRKKSQISNIPIVMITASPDKDDIEKCRDAGINGYVVRPCSPNDLKQLLSEVIAGSGSNYPVTAYSSHVMHNKEESALDLRILLVEDNAVNQQVTRKMLHTLGCTCRVADNGSEGVAAWREEDFDLILMDCHMPVTDGLSATSLIRREEKFGFHIPIVAYTADINKELKAQCLAVGMDDFLSKPITIQSLEMVLKRWQVRLQESGGQLANINQNKPGVA